MDAPEEQRQVDLVTERLAVKFPQLQRETIAAAVRDAEAGMLAAPIREYVPILVEKQARDWLAAQLRPASPTSTTG